MMAGNVSPIRTTIRSTPHPAVFYDQGGRKRNAFYDNCNIILDMTEWILGNVVRRFAQSISNILSCFDVDQPRAKGMVPPKRMSRIRL